MPVDYRFHWDEEGRNREPRTFVHEAEEGMAGVQKHTREAEGVEEEEVDLLPSRNGHGLLHNGHDDPLLVDKTVENLSHLGAMVDPSHTKSLHKEEDPCRDAEEVVGVQKRSHEALLPCIHEKGVHPPGIFAEVTILERIQQIPTSVSVVWARRVVLREDEDSRGARSCSSWTEARWRGLAAVRTDEVDTVQLGLVVACSDLDLLGLLETSPWHTRCIQDSHCSLDDLLVAAAQGDYKVDGGLERNRMVQLDNHSMALTVLLVAKKGVDHLVLLVGEGATSMLACLRYQVDIQEVC
jgi:hypothetical protein